MKELGDYIEEIRALPDWSQYSLAKHLGVSRQAITEMKNTGRCKLDHAVKIAGVLGIDPKEVIMAVDQKSNPENWQHWEKWVAVIAVMAVGAAAFEPSILVSESVAAFTPLYIMRSVILTVIVTLIAIAVLKNSHHTISEESVSYG